MKKITSGELGKFTKKLGKLVGSGIPLLESLEILREENSENELAKILETTNNMLKNGKKLYESFGSFPSVFTKSYIESIKNGEHSGNLDHALVKIAENIAEGVIEVGKGESNYDTILEEFSSSNNKVIQFVNHLFNKAVEEKASKLIIQPTRENALIKLQKGQSYEQIDSIEMELYVRAVARIKMLSALDLSEKRLPQDGRILIKISEHLYDIKVVLFPSIFGEQVVLKIFNNNEKLPTPEQVFPLDEDRKKIQELMDNPSGMVVFAGPSGSGKTTSMQTAIMMVDTTKKSVITVEDPVYNVIPGVSQIMARSYIGLTLLAASRSAARAEPDVMMLGNLNDEETAQAAFNYANNGILIVTQMGAKSPYEVFRQFLNLKVPPYLLYGGIAGVVFQILIRRLCKHCLTKIDVKPQDLDESERDLIKTGQYNETTGCEQCRNTGYLGRVALYEILVPDKDLMDAIMSGDVKQIEAQTNKLQRAKIQDRLIQSLEKGETGLSEVRRILSKLQK